VEKQRKKTSWLYNVLVSLDQLGNTIAGGNPDSSISARVGYFANKGASKTKTPKYWKFLENIINFTFWPVDGENHCIDAYERDCEEHNSGNILFNLISAGAYLKY